jgi:uncharacterized membrane protein (UPF0127 family)
VKSVSNVTPWRIVLGGPGACSVLEMGTGWFDAGSVRVGDVIEFVADTAA